MIKLVLHDAARRLADARGQTDEFFLGEHNPLLVRVPPGVWHGWKCVSCRGGVHRQRAHRGLQVRRPGPARAAARLARDPVRLGREAALGAAGEAMLRWFVTGAGGQLATAFTRVLEGEVFLSREAALDIRDAEAVRAAVHGFAPDVVLHTAAYTDVDGAEADPATARGGQRGRHAQPRRRACAARTPPSSTSAPTTSSTAAKGSPYVESDAPRPAGRVRAHQARRRGRGAELGARHRGAHLLAVQRDGPELREDHPRRGPREGGGGRAAAGRGRPGGLADVRGSPGRGGGRGSAQRPRPRRLPHGRQRLLLLVRAGPRSRAARRHRRSRWSRSRRPSSAARRRGRPSRRSSASARSRGCRTGPTGVAEAVDRLIPLG